MVISRGLHIWFHLNRNYSLGHPGLFVPNDPLKNVMAMTTAENQEQADKRIPHLLKADFAYRGLSVEPMLGPVDLMHDYDPIGGLRTWLDMLDFIACGPETGTGDRVLDQGWIYNLYEQCKAAGVSFFDKRKDYLAREFPE